MNAKTKKWLLIGGGLAAVYYFVIRKPAPAAAAPAAKAVSGLSGMGGLHGGTLGANNMLKSEMGSLGCCGK